jgi:hypothetical protein
MQKKSDHYMTEVQGIEVYDKQTNVKIDTLYTTLTFSEKHNTAGEVRTAIKAPGYEQKISNEIYVYNKNFH